MISEFIYDSLVRLHPECEYKLRMINKLEKLIDMERKKYEETIKQYQDDVERLKEESGYNDFTKNTIFDDSDKVMSLVKGLSHDQLMKNIKNMLDVVNSYSSIDGEHHKKWLIDRMLLCCIGEDAYNQFIKEYNDYKDENGEIYDLWDSGIAP